MRYLPRQDKVDHGTVADYEFYLSEDAGNWGTPVAGGSFEADRQAKLVRFEPRTGRYVRFLATREIGDRAYTSIAELDLIGTPR